METPPKMTRKDLDAYISTLDQPLRIIFGRAEDFAKKSDDVLSDEFQIASKIFDVFDRFANAWFYRNEESDE